MGTQSILRQGASDMARSGPLDVRDVVQLRSQRQVRADAQHLPVCAPPGAQQQFGPWQAKTACTMQALCNPQGCAPAKPFKAFVSRCLAAPHGVSYTQSPQVCALRAGAHQSWHQPALYISKGIELQHTLRRTELALVDHGIGAQRAHAVHAARRQLLAAHLHHIQRVAVALRSTPHRSIIGSDLAVPPASALVSPTSYPACWKGTSLAGPGNGTCMIFPESVCMLLPMGCVAADWAAPLGAYTK